MVTGEFFTILAVKLEVTTGALGWIKILAETVTPLLFGPFFGWLADRIGAGKVIALRSVADRKSTRLNSSHLGSSYAVLCLQKKIGQVVAVHPKQTNRSRSEASCELDAKEVVNAYVVPSETICTRR